MSTGLRDELFVLKGKLELLEKELTDQMMELEVKADKWAKLDEEAENIVKVGNNIVYLDVGGKKFQTKLETLLSIKDTLFFRMVLDHKVDLSQEVFIDRANDYFHIMLSFLRNKKVNLQGYSTKVLREVLEEAAFYEITDLIGCIEEYLSEVTFVKFETNGTYTSGGTVAGTQNIDHINDTTDRSMTKGICAISPGWIIFEVNREVEFEEIEVAGWGGNTGIWGHTNGSGASVQTSNDKTNWTTVGTIGNNLSVISKVKLTRSKGKYVKISCNSYLGIGFFRIIKCD
jgi:hypothetical protein